MVNWYRVKIIKEAQHGRDRLHFLSPAVSSSSHLDLRENGRVGFLWGCVWMPRYSIRFCDADLPPGTGERLATIWVSYVQMC